MKVGHALDQIERIHEHLARTEVYRGSHSVPVAFSGVLAVGGWALQPWLVPAPTPLEFVAYWVAIAAASIGTVGGEIVWRYVMRSGPAARRMTRKVVGQFAPCIAAGGLLTVTIAFSGPQAIAFLPGLWAVLLGLGLFSARPLLPRTIGWVALFYLCAGVVLVWRAGSAPAPESWGMGAAFGLGQFFSALVLYWNLERREDG
jgi:hypothetical protein